MRASGGRIKGQIKKRYFIWPVATTSGYNISEGIFDIVSLLGVTHEKVEKKIKVHFWPKKLLHKIEILVFKTALARASRELEP